MFAADECTRSGSDEDLRCRRPVNKLARLIAMSVSEQMPLADVKNRLSEVVDRLQREHSQVFVHAGSGAVCVMCGRCP